MSLDIPYTPPTPFEKIAGWIEDIRTGRWAWYRNSRCKYVTLFIDTRRGVTCIKDRDGNEISFEELMTQIRATTHA